MIPTQHQKPTTYKNYLYNLYKINLHDFISI